VPSCAVHCQPRRPPAAWRLRDQMPLDPATLHDLDVLSTSTPRGPTLLGLVDRTRSRAGREALRQRLVAPSDSVDGILALQRAHQSLAADAASYRALFDRTDTDAAERYLNSTWQLPSARPALARLVDGLWRPRWFREFMREVGTGRFRVLSLLRAAGELSSRLAATKAQSLQELGAKLAALLSTREAQGLLDLEGRESTAGHVAFDQLARDAARPMLLELIAHVGTLEAMWSFGVATAEHGWSYPRPAAQLRTEGLSHPFLGRGAIANDLHLDHQTRVCFVTGPNMAGKSTFLKAVGIAVLLAHAGCGVPAASMEFATVRTIFSSVQIVDNLSAGESFYLAEVRRIRSLAVALRDHRSAFAVLDEPFRGTNVHDAAEATLAVIARLVTQPAALVFVASHLAEIVPSVVDDPRVCLLHFSADVTGERPVFDYQLQRGLSTQRLGMTLLKQEGVLDLLDASSATVQAAIPHASEAHSPRGVG
jgi:DNA mismatch repair protein MutS